MSDFAFYIKDFGCRINQYDTRLVEKNLIGMGKTSTALKEADIVLVNTCSVTHRAQRDGLKYTRRIKRLYPDKEIIVFGCSVRNDRESFERIGVKTHDQFMYLDNPSGSINKFYGYTRAFINIQQGCRSACTYCVVKKIKTPYYKKQPEAVVKEITELTKNHPECVICATNFNEYTDLLELVEKIRGIESEFRWRFSSLPPELLTERFLNLLKMDARFCRHFHIPVQSASDDILSRMGRGYRLKHIMDSIERVKRILPEIALSYDIIAGFPGETDKDFYYTLKFIEDTRPVKIHAFRYSDRPGTPAYEYYPKVPEKIKKERVIEIVGVSDRIRREHFSESIGKIKEVIIEKDGYGYTRGYLPVKIDGAGFSSKEDRIFNEVEVIDCNNMHLIGKVR